MKRTTTFSVICCALLIGAVQQTVGNPVDDGVKELERLSHALQDPLLDDKQIAAMVRVDKIPMDQALKDLSAVVKLMVVEHQLTLQSLRVISIALEKLSKRVHGHHHTSGDGQTEPEMAGRSQDSNEDIPEKAEIVKRSILSRFRRELPDQEAPSEDGANVPKSRQKRWFFGSLFSPWYWGGGYGYGYGYGYPYYYGGYYPYSSYYYYPYSYYPYYYYPTLRTATAAPAALRKAAKKAALKKDTTAAAPRSAQKKAAA